MIETKEPESGADPFTQLKGSHLRIVLIIRIRFHPFDRFNSLRATRGFFEMDLPAQVSLDHFSRRMVTYETRSDCGSPL